MWWACQIQKPSALSLKLPSLCCVLESYTLFISFVLSYSTSMFSSSLSHVAATSYSPSHVYLSFLSPCYLCARPRGLSHDLVSMLFPVFCLQPRKCATCQVWLLLTFRSDKTLRQSHFNDNMNDQPRQNSWLSNSFVEKPKSNIWPKIPPRLLTPIVFTKSQPILILR